jgi:lipopolysaccharide transport system permease protein
LLNPSPTRRETVITAPSLSGRNLLSQISQFVRYRDLLYTLSAHRISVRYKQTLLGLSWAILQPVSMTLIFTVVFSFIAKMPSEGAPYPVFVYTALLAWSFFSSSLINATGSLVSHSQLVNKVYFPREILPLTYVVAALFDFIIASVVMAGLMLYYDVKLTVNVLYAIPIIILLAVFVTSMAFLFSATQVRFRDIGVAMPLLVQLWMFATPVIYPLSSVPIRLRSFYDLNPMVGIIHGFRQTVLQGMSPDFKLLSTSALATVIFLPLSYLYFKRVEATVADVI